MVLVVQSLRIINSKKSHVAMGQNNSKQIQKGLQSRSILEFVGPGPLRTNPYLHMLCATAICRKGMGCQET